jgi:hypothetical protein
MLRQDSRCGYAYRQNRRLSVFCQPQLVFRPVKEDMAQRETECFIGFGEGGGGYRELFGKISSHAYGLGALSGKEKGNSTCRHFFRIVPEPGDRNACGQTGTRSVYKISGL